MDPTITPWDRFINSFFKLSVMRDYLPEIIDGFLLTCYLALEIVAAGLALGLALAVRINEAYGTVAVFEDPFGNLWDLIQPK